MELKFLNKEKYDDLLVIEKEAGTPVYIFHIDKVKSKCEKIHKQLINKFNLCFSVKSNPYLVKYLHKEFERIEVCSVGELEICIKSGVPLEKIIYGGIQKSEKELKYVIDNGVRIISIESIYQMNILNKIIREQHKKINVFLRLSSGNQFGMDITNIEQIVQYGIEEGITVKGIHYYSGTQKKNQSKVIDEIKMLEEKCNQLREVCGFKVQEIEYGPGLGVKYFQEETNIKEDMLSNNVLEALRNLKNKYVITLEMGRYLLADIGEYVTKVCEVKENNHRKYCIVDGGSHHISYYGQVVGRRNPIYYLVQRDSSDKLVDYTVCGSLCTSNDVLIKHLFARSIKQGDFIVFQKVGAYSITEVPILFLSRNFPAIIVEQNGKIEVLRKVKDCYMINMLDWSCDK